MASKKKKDQGEATQTRQENAEAFVMTWQKCKTLSEAKEKLGDHASARAARYRKAGVALQKFSRESGLDFSSLKSLVKE